MKRTRKQVEGDSESRVYDEVAPWGLLSCLLTSVSLCHRFCGCEQVSAMSAFAHTLVYVPSGFPSRLIGALDVCPDPAGSL